MMITRISNTTITPTMAPIIAALLLPLSSLLVIPAVAIGPMGPDISGIGTLVELVTPTLPGIEITGDGDEVNDRDEVMDEGDNEAEDCIIEVEDCIIEVEDCIAVANELVAVDDTVKDAEDAVGVMVDKLVVEAITLQSLSTEMHGHNSGLF